MDISQTVLSSLQRKGEESNHQRILLDKIHKFAVFPDWKKENYVPFFIFIFRIVTRYHDS
jgi:hypothetical protein